MNEYCANDGKKIGTHAKVTTTKSSWHQTSRKYECEWNRKPIEMIFRTSSHVKTARKKVSQWPMNSSFHVPFGSSGDSHAIVKQFAAIATWHKRLKPFMLDDLDCETANGRVRRQGIEGKVVIDLRRVAVAFYCRSRRTATGLRGQVAHRDSASSGSSAAATGAGVGDGAEEELVDTDDETDAGAGAAFVIVSGSCRASPMKGSKSQKLHSSSRAPARNDPNLTARIFRSGAVGFCVASVAGAQDGAGREKSCA